MGPMARREALDAYIGLSPWIIGFLLFTLGPILASIYLGFTQWNIATPAKWVGLANYERMFTSDPLFWTAVKVTLLYILMSVPMQLVGGLALSLLLNFKLRGMYLYRTIFYIPAVISGVAVSMMFMWIMQPEYGVVNTLLDLVGIDGPGWFWDPDWALFSVALMSLWRVGGSAVIFLAGLQNIPPHLYEAAAIDGASSWYRFWRITLPLLTPVLFFQLIINLIDAFKVFTEAHVITKGGPLKATYFYMLYLYEEAFQSSNMGYASALSWVITILILLFTLLLFYTSNRRVYYESSAEGEI
ncbi:sugar ABC transporter permease [Chloroflexi bacterium TSY]|nr:sugar ABC transporter permease [Chloroflexi bacterium TSY]